MNDFLTWWIEKHWFWSTVLTPGITFAWACYKGLFWRGVVSLLLLGGSTTVYKK